MSTSSREHFDEPQHLSIPFQVPSRGPCTATITVQPNRDPISHGLGLINLYPDASIIKNYPVLHASVSSPDSLTYTSLYGWIQLTKVPDEPWVMDLYPIFAELNNPFMIWGAKPTLVDAPNRDGVQSYDWTARSFLCYTPDAAMTKHVVPIFGFEWGFSIETYKPFVKQLKSLPIGAWNEHLELLRGKYTGWTFEES